MASGASDDSRAAGSLPGDAGLPRLRPGAAGRVRASKLAAAGLAGLLALLSGCAAPSGREEGGGFEMNALPEALPPRPAENVLIPTLDSLMGERWWGLYANQTRIGRVHLAGKRVQTAEGEGVGLAVESLLEVPPPTVRLRWEAQYAKNGKPLYLRETTQEENLTGGQSRSRTFEVRGAQVQCVGVDPSGAARETAYPWPEESAFLLAGLEGPEMFMVAASVQPLVGKSYEYIVAGPTGPVPLRIDVEDREIIPVRDQNHDCLRLLLQQGTLSRRVWMTDERQVVKWAEIRPDGKEGIVALLGTAEQADSDLGGGSGLPGPHEVVLAFIKGVVSDNRELIDLQCDYDALYGSFQRDGRAKAISRSAFNAWFRNRVMADANLRMSARSVEILRPLLKTVIRGNKAAVSFQDPASGKDFFRFSFRLSGRGWLVVNYEP